MHRVVVVLLCFYLCHGSRKRFQFSRNNQVADEQKISRGRDAALSSLRNVANSKTDRHERKLLHLLLSVSPTFHGSLARKKYLRATTSQASDESQADPDMQADFDSLFKNPSDFIQRWRKARFDLCGEVLDMSRYHVQVLFVDDDACRARTAEVMLERVAEWADMGWWIYANAATIGTAICDRDDRSMLKTRSAEFQFPEQRLFAPTERFYDSYVLDGTYDMIVCMDSGVADKVRASVKRAAKNDMAADGPPPDAIVLALSDFLEVGQGRLGTPWDGTLGASTSFDEQLQALVAGQAGIGQLITLPRARPSQPEEWRRFMAVCALASLGMASYIKQEFENFFVNSYKELLEVFYHRPENVNVTWDECEESLRQHIVTGGLSIKERRQLFEEHQVNLRKRFPEAL